MISCAKVQRVSNENDYRLSFLYYLMFGVVSTLFAGLPVVYFTADGICDSSFSGGNGTGVNDTNFSSSIYLNFFLRVQWNLYIKDTLGPA